MQIRTVGRSWYHSIQWKRLCKSSSKEPKHLKQNPKYSKKKAEVFEKKSIDQERELMMLRPVKDTAIGICDRFFATFLKSKASGHIILGNHSVIEIGNQKAHEGDVETDICLLEHDMIRYPTTFRRLYGLAWAEAKSLLGMPTEPEYASKGKGVANRFHPLGEIGLPKETKFCA